jgi:hypothetical protein
MLGSSWVAAQLAASQEEVCSVSEWQKRFILGKVSWLSPQVCNDLFFRERWLQPLKTQLFEEGSLYPYLVAPHFREIMRTPRDHSCKNSYRPGRFNEGFVRHLAPLSRPAASLWSCLRPGPKTTHFKPWFSPESRAIWLQHHETACNELFFCS